MDRKIKGSVYLSNVRIKREFKRSDHPLPRTCASGLDTPSLARLFLSTSVGSSPRSPPAPRLNSGWRLMARWVSGSDRPERAA